MTMPAKGSRLSLGRRRGSCSILQGHAPCKPHRAARWKEGLSSTRPDSVSPNDPIRDRDDPDFSAMIVDAIGDGLAVKDDSYPKVSVQRHR